MSSGKFVKKRTPLSGKVKKLLAVCLILAVLSGIFFLAWRHRSRMLLTQSAAEAWRGSSELAFRQVSVFLPVDEPKTEADILSFRRSLESALVDASLDPAADQILYRDAWSGTAGIQVSTPRATASVKALGVGGDYFLFHPLQLVSGSYISDSDYMTDRVVLDENLAWNLFGSTDVAGMEVSIGSRNYPIAGVIRRETDSASKKAYAETMGMFMCYGALNQITEVPISCYELVMPEPITDFAETTVTEKFGVGNGITVVNTNRFSPLRLWKVLRGFGERSMNTHAVIYPYWENAARLCEDWAALYLLLAILLGLFPAVCAVVVLIRLLVKTLKELVRKLIRFFDGRIEARKTRRYARKGL